MERMRPLETDKAPVEVPRADRKGAHWIKPKLVAEIAFGEFTDDGILRHPSFIALREDKPASEVVREVPKHLTAKPRKRRTHATAESFGIEISNPDRVIFPEDGLTKGELADYYAAVEPLIMVDAAQRPMTLIRCPQGRAEKCFFQKHDSGTFGPHVKHIPIEEKDGDVEDYLYFDDIKGCSPASRWARSNSTAGAARSTRSNIPTGWCSTSTPTSGSTSQGQGRCGAPARRCSQTSASRPSRC